MSRIVFRASTPADYPALAAFLGRIFGVPPGDPGPFLREDHVTWKYWAPYPGWAGSRSFLVERNGQILAHGAVLPLTIRTGNADIPAVQLYDWAAEPTAIGVGLTLLRQVAKRCGPIVSIGGSGTTTKMREPMGFHPRNLVYSCTRVLRPLAEAMAPPLSWKTPLRMAKYTTQAMAIPALRTPGIHVTEVQPAEMERSVLPSPLPGYLAFAQTPAQLTFLQRCPSASFRFYLVHDRDRRVGSFVLRDRTPVAQVIEAWVAPDERIGWDGLFSLIAAQARRDLEGSQLSCYAPSEAMRQGIGRVGFRTTYEQPVHVYDPTSVLPAGAGLFLQLAQTDYAFFS